MASGFAFVIALTTPADSAEAARIRWHSNSIRTAAALRGGFSHAHWRYAGYARHSGWYSGSLQCVPFARENSGIELSGNAGAWWDNAAGVYERGARPEVGSILNFRATGHMRMGHVAVVANVLNGRHIEIDHANWGGPGQVSRNIDVVDVSPNNDWTAVRVERGHSDEFGGVYPTFGFIYDRPDHGVMVANKGVITAPLLNPAPADYRSAAERIDVMLSETAPEEVAEVDDGPAPRVGRRHWSRGHGGRWPLAHRHLGALVRESAYHPGLHAAGLGRAHKLHRHF